MATLMCGTIKVTYEVIGWLQQGLISDYGYVYIATDHLIVPHLYALYNSCYYRLKFHCAVVINWQNGTHIFTYFATSI